MKVHIEKTHFIREFSHHHVVDGVHICPVLYCKNPFFYGSKLLTKHLRDPSIHTSTELLNSGEEPYKLIDTLSKNSKKPMIG